MYTNDQPTFPYSRHFIYADDLALTVQGEALEATEHQLASALEVISLYYQNNQLKPNPLITQFCVYQLKNREADRMFRINRENKILKPWPTTKYMSVTDLQKHCLNTKQKVSTRDNIVMELSQPDWGAHPQRRTTALFLCYSMAEYASAMCYKSAHSNKCCTMHYCTYVHAIYVPLCVQRRSSKWPR